MEVDKCLIEKHRTNKTVDNHDLRSLFPGFCKLHCSSLPVIYAVQGLFVSELFTPEQGIESLFHGLFQLVGYGVSLSIMKVASQ
jgi:hypothetical protein